MSFTLSTRLGRSDDILHAPVDADNAVILDVESGNYYGLNAVAARIWEMLGEGPMTIAEICKRLCEEFEVEGATCQAAVLEFADTLIENGVVHAVAP